MADEFPRDRPHLFINGGGAVEPYRRPNQAMNTPALPARDRAGHAAALEAAIGTALDAARRQLADRDAGLAAGTPGFYLEVVVPSGERAVIDQLADRRKHMEVVAVREGNAGQPITASVFVPTRAEDYYLSKVRDYRDRETAGGRPRNEPLVTRMETVRLSSAASARSALSCRPTA